MDLPWRAGRVWACLLITLITLLPSSSSAASEDAFRASNDSLLWGPYKPNLYFGVRPRIPKSLSVSLMWSRVEDVTVQRSMLESAFSPPVLKPSTRHTNMTPSQPSDTPANKIRVWLGTAGKSTMLEWAESKSFTTKRTESTL